MRIFKYLVALYVLLDICHCVAAQWCAKLQYVTKTRIQWNNGQRQTSKLTFFGNVKYKYEPYLYSSMQYYNDYERVTVCCDGYTKISDTVCKPICNPSCPTNTHCIRPNVCECDTGYVGYTSQPAFITCRPVCMPECPENASCSKPGTCSCDQGYRKTANGTCEPVCDSECPLNSQCLRPNECGCSQGYGPSLLNKMKCEPQCKDPCPLNSICAEPDKCTCEQGYEMVGNKCQAICDPGCPENGFCKKPNQCECRGGYELGKTEDNSLECMPKCNDECPENGYCSEPNVCECNTGYAKSASNDTCDAICQPECPENAVCREPNSCSCRQGYQMLDNLCQPICEQPCPEHSHCSQPNKCECSAGYQLKLSSIYNIYCEPQCQRNCSANGQCVQPNKCECLAGYEMDEVEDCKPVCSDGCLNGLCYLPDVCICNAGYLMGPHNLCQPVCSMPCQNGSCVEPEICQCSAGYRLKQGTVNICEPQCQPECVNGVCVAANVCVCHDDYEPLEQEGGVSNHSYCQRITRSTVEDYPTSPESMGITSLPEEVDEAQATIEPTPPTIPENISITTTSPLSASTLGQCLDLCQCWQEYDPLGAISTKTQCMHPCADPYDKPCLNFTQCRCDAAKLQLICEFADDFDEDPIVYGCRIQRIQVATTTTSKTSIEMKSTADHKDSSKLWIILPSIMLICGLATLATLLYKKYYRREDNNAEVRSLEYEL